MQRLFRRILHFSLFLALSIIVVCVVIRCLLLRISEDKIAEYRNASTLILGDSHPAETLLTDSIDGSFSFAFGGEALPSGYTALRLLSKDSLSNIQLVIFGTSYHSFRQWNPHDTAFYYRFLFSLYPLIHGRTEQMYQEEIPACAITEVTYCYKWGFPSPKSIPELKRILRKIPATSTAIAPIPIEWETRIEQQFYDKLSHTPIPPSHADIQALQNIQELCRRKGYFLVLYNAPVPRDYYVNIPPFYKHLMDSIIRSVVDNQTTFYIDHSQYPLPDNHFRDCDHVNIHGAKIVTPLLRDSLRSLGILPSNHAM